MYKRKALPGPATIDPAVNQAQYEADCLAGRRFPIGTDTAMQARCREAWRLREWFEIYRRYHLARLQDSRNRESRLRRHFIDLQDLDPSRLSRLTLMPWFQILGSKSQSAANDAIKELKFIYNKMIEFGWHLGANPVAGMKPFPHRKPRSRFVQLDELDSLIESIEQEPPHYQLIFFLCINVGCRPGEAVAMKWADVKTWQEADPVTGSLVWRGRWSKPTTKTGLPHIVPIPTDLAARFQALERTSEWVFPGDAHHWRRATAGPVCYSKVHKVWQRVCRRINIANLRPHDLRRTCATFLVNRGTNLALVSKGVLNHTSLQNTGIYTQSMLEPVQAALQEHSEFIMAKHRESLGVPPISASVHHREAPSAMEWPG